MGEYVELHGGCGFSLLLTEMRRRSTRQNLQNPPLMIISSWRSILDAAFSAAFARRSCDITPASERTSKSWARGPGGTWKRFQHDRTANDNTSENR